MKAALCFFAIQIKSSILFGNDDTNSIELFVF